MDDVIGESESNDRFKIGFSGRLGIGELDSESEGKEEDDERANRSTACGLIMTVSPEPVDERENCEGFATIASRPGLLTSGSDEEDPELLALSPLLLYFGTLGSCRISSGSDQAASYLIQFASSDIMRS